MSLSLYRIHKSDGLRAFFIVCATVNATYCSVWDLVMDWSLIDPTAKHRFLRENLAYKQIWMYYLAMIIDPILRFNWIFYAIYADDVQHSAILSFLISLSEIFRRGMWTIFRVENEHCTNVGRFRASRDIPLPYHLESSENASGDGVHTRTSDEEEQRHTVSPLITVPSRTSGADLSRTRTHTSESSAAAVRRRKHTPSPLMTGLSRVGSILHMAHVQDFERKRRPELGDDKDDDGDGSSDEDDDKIEEEGVHEDVAAATSVARDGQIDETVGEEEEEEEANEDNNFEGNPPLWRTSSERIRSGADSLSQSPNDSGAGPLTGDLDSRTMKG
jgi:hypothetical protein